MTRVVHLISGLMYGGGQKVALDLVDGLQQATKVEPQLWLLGCRYVGLETRAQAIIPYDGNYASPITLLSAAGAVRKRLAAKKVDIVHSHGWDADMIAYLATLQRKERRVIHLHVTPSWIFSKAPQHRARRVLTTLMLSAQRSRSIAVAGAVRDHWARVFPQLVTAGVVYNCADPVRFRAAEEQSPAGEPTLTLGVVCRLASQKGLRVLLHAFSGLVRRLSVPIRLRIAGEGSERRSLEELAHNLNIAGSVQFLGHVDDVERFHRSLDIFVLPSVSDEGMPLAILEAMASGLPIVATDVGGTRELVRHGVDGLVVAPNSVDALADALAALGQDTEQRRQMSRNAAQRVQTDFSPRSQIEAVMATYEELTA